jgi:hypothetical protein
MSLDEEITGQEAQVELKKVTKTMEKKENRNPLVRGKCEDKPGKSESDL